MVLGLVGALVSLVKTQNSKTFVDSRVFRLHYRWTTALLFTCCAFLAATEYFGDPIKYKDASKPITTYCWISGAFILKTSTGKG